MPAGAVTLLCKPFDNPFECSHKYICTDEEHYCRPVTQQKYVKENLNSYSISVLIILSRQYKGRVKQTHP